jgi:NAD(P)-dependent dehydrogenase (short-subunit alcohol dehydrogenase family)
MKLKNKTVLITGASRGIGKAIALKLASEGANIIVAAKSVQEDARLGGTIFSVANEIDALGSNALPVQCDVRFEEQVLQVVQLGVETFGGIDVVINNASAINLSTAEQLTMKQFDLMQTVNARATFMVAKSCLPHLKKSTNAHILTLSPPLNMDLKWFGSHVAYTISKYNMTMIANGLAEEWKKYKIASNTLWPVTTIDTAAVRNLLGGEALAKMSRTTDIIADAALAIVTRPAAENTGNNYLDEDVLKEEGVKDFSHYAVVAGATLYKDLFLD